MAPKVSIIIPVYNVANYLPECLDSLIAQTFKDIEIICFNDASTDNSLEILKDYASKDGRIKIIDSPVNIRQGGGRNRGIRASKGEYIMFVDSDDWVTTNYVETLYQTAVNNDSDIVTADYFESKNGKINEISLLGKHNERLSTEQLKRKILINGCRLVTSIFKKELFLKNDLFFPEGVIYEDNAIGPALFLSARKLTKIDKSIYYYRIGNTSTTRSKDNYQFFDRLQTSIMMFNNTKRIGVYDTFEEEIKRLFIRLFYIYSICGAIYSFTNPCFTKISYIRKNVTMYVTEAEINKELQRAGLKTRISIYMACHFPKLLKVLKIAQHIKDSNSI